MAFDTSTYKIIATSNIGRGEQGRTFIGASDDPLTTVTTAGYLDDWIGAPHALLLSRPLIDGDTMLWQVESDTNPMWIYLMVKYDATGDTYTLVPQTVGYATKSVLASFDTDGVGSKKIYFNTAAKIYNVRFITDIALAGTDTGSVNLLDDQGNPITSADLQIPASSAVGFEVAATVTDDNSVVAAGSYVTVSTAKVTEGGQGTLYIDYY